MTMTTITWEDVINAMRMPGDAVGGRFCGCGHSVKASHTLKGLCLAKDCMCGRIRPEPVINIEMSVDDQAMCKMMGDVRSQLVEAMGQQLDRDMAGLMIGCVHDWAYSLDTTQYECQKCGTTTTTILSEKEKDHV